MHRSSSKRTVIATACAAFVSSFAFAGVPKKHADIWLRPTIGLNGPQIVTGSISEGAPGTPIDDIERVFGAELDEDPLFPFSGDEPGLQALADSLTSGMTWSFNITAPLGRWNGDGFDIAGESMRIEFGPASTTSGAGFVPGFSFTGGPDGLAHAHFDFTLQGAPLAGIPGDGIYLLALEFLGVNGAVSYDASEPAYLVFNLNLDEREHDAAIDWVYGNLVPCPAPLAMLCMMLASSRRRRTE